MQVDTDTGEPMDMDSRRSRIHGFKTLICILQVFISAPKVLICISKVLICGLKAFSCAFVRVGNGRDMGKMQAPLDLRGVQLQRCIGVFSGIDTCLCSYVIEGASIYETGRQAEERHLGAILSCTWNQMSPAYDIRVRYPPTCPAATRE